MAHRTLSPSLGTCLSGPNPPLVTLLEGLISQLSASLSSRKPAWRRRLRHSATAVGKETSHRAESGRGHTGPNHFPCPGYLPWKGEGLRFTNLRSSRAAACTASLRALPVMAT